MSNKIVLSYAAFKAAVDQCAASGIFSFDIETAPKDEFRDIEKYPNASFSPATSDVCTLSFTDNTDYAFVVPISHRVGANIQVNKEDLWGYIQSKIFSNKNVLKIAFNAVFECNFMTSLGCFLDSNMSDPHVLAVRVKQVLVPDTLVYKAPNKGQGLKDLSQSILGVTMDKFEQVLRDNNIVHFDELDIRDGCSYSAEDSIYSLALHNYFKELAEQIHISDECNGTDIGHRPYKNYYEFIHGVEAPVTRAIGMMECYGLAFNMEKSEESKVIALEALKEAQSSLVGYGLAHNVKVTPGKTGKTLSVKHLLFDVLGCPILKKSSKTGAVSLDAGAIRDTRKMIELNLKNAKLLDKLDTVINLCSDIDPKKAAKYRALYIEKHEYRDEILAVLRAIDTVQKISTLIGSHIDGRIKWMSPGDARIKARYSMWTDTSRFASKNPNGQNIPSVRKDRFKIRSMHEPSPGCIFVLIDYSAQEVRIGAELYRDEVMIDLIQHGADMHSYTANAVFKLGLKDGEPAPKEERTAAKTAFFGMAYGGSAKSLQDTYRDYDLYKGTGYCKQVIEGIEDAYKGMVLFQDKAVEFAVEHGYIETILGFRRMLPVLDSPDVLLDRATAMALKDIKLKSMEALEDKLATFRYEGKYGLVDEYMERLDRGVKKYMRLIVSSASRQAMNTPIQGTAADVTKHGLNKIMDLYSSGRIDSRYVKLVATIHDENAFEINASHYTPGEVKDIVKMLCDSMEDPIFKDQKLLHIAEPEVADPFDVYAIGESNGWADKYDFDKWLKKVESRGSYKTKIVDNSNDEDVF